jgi:hypothetical protein
LQNTLKNKAVIAQHKFITEFWKIYIGEWADKNDLHLETTGWGLGITDFHKCARVVAAERVSVVQF